MKIKEGKEQNWKEWQECNTDMYGGQCISFAKKWAAAMEIEMELGKKLEDVADKTCSDIDKQLGQWGLTGFMYGMVVAVLADVWEHGERLKKWHNTKHGQPDAKGTVNPAILVLKEEKDEAEN